MKLLQKVSMGEAAFKMPLPTITNVGRVPIRLVEVFHSNLMLKAGPVQRAVMFWDIEGPREQYRVMKETEIHLGIKADFQLGYLRPGERPRIDIYFGLKDLDNVLRSCGLNGNCQQTDRVDFPGGPHDIKKGV